jgi:hypothetical protein
LGPIRPSELANLRSIVMVLDLPHSFADIKPVCIWFSFSRSMGNCSKRPHEVGTGVGRFCKGTIQSFHEVFLSSSYHFWVAYAVYEIICQYRPATYTNLLVVCLCSAFDGFSEDAHRSWGWFPRGPIVFFVIPGLCLSILGLGSLANTHGLTRYYFFLPKWCQQTHRNFRMCLHSHTGSGRRVAFRYPSRFTALAFLCL